MPQPAVAGLHPARRLPLLLHRLDRLPHGLATAAELQDRLTELGLAPVRVDTGLAGLIARLDATKPEPSHERSETAC